MELQNAINHARLAKAIHAEKRDVPSNAALVALLAEVERLKKANELVSADWSICQKKAVDLQAEVERLREALKEIRDIADCSEGVEFYSMLARNALDGECEEYEDQDPRSMGWVGGDGLP